MPTLKDEMRFENKKMLKEWANEFKTYFDSLSAPKDDTIVYENLKLLKKLLPLIDEYSKIDSTAVKYVEREDELCNQIFNSLNKAFKELDEDDINRGYDDKAYDNDNLNLKNDKLYYDVFRAISRFHLYFEGQRNGYLDVPPEVEEKRKDSVIKNIKNPSFNASEIEYLKRKTQLSTKESIEGSNKQLEDVPLFPHDPSYDDIVQGGIGDCYLVASLASIAANDPAKIKESMIENEDKTVTVRFFQRKMGPNGPESDTYEPIYVTVDKISPTFGSAKKCAWVDVIERAYAASGLKLSNAQDTMDSEKYAEGATPEKLNELYEKLLKTDRSDWPSREECPWLIDEEGNLHKYEPSYDNIIEGQPGFFTEQFLGPDYQAKQIFLQLTEMIPQPWNLLCDSVRDCLTEDGSKLTRTQSKQVGNDLSNPEAAAKYYYKMLTGTDNIPKLPDGSLDKNNPDVRVCLAFSKDLMHYFDCQVSPGIRNKIRPAGDLTGLDYYLNESGDVKNEYKEPYTIKEGLTPAEIVQYKKLMTKMENAFSKTNYKHYEATEPYNGMYNTKQLDIVKQIEQAIKNKQPVTFGTRNGDKSLGDKDVVDGLNLHHAYSVLGVERTRVAPGKYLYFLRIRNPHATTGREYDLSNPDNITKKASTVNTNGESLIELGDAIREGGHITINQPPVSEFAPEPMPRISKQDVSKYFRVVESILDTLEKAKAFNEKKDSPEYKELKKELKEIKKDLHKLHGQNLNNINNKFDKAAKAAENYLSHCNKVKKSGNTRKTRMECAEAVKNLRDMAKNHIMDPKEYCKIRVANKIVNFAAKQHGRSITSNQREVAIEKLINSKDFKSSYGKAGPYKLLADEKLAENALTKNYVSFIKEMKNAELQREAPAPQKDKAISKPSNEKKTEQAQMNFS